MIEKIIVGELATNCYIYKTEIGKLIIVDPGGQAKKITEHLLQYKEKPYLIVCTHGHLDHISAIEEIMDLYNGEDEVIKLAVHEKAIHFFGKEAYNSQKKIFQSLGPGAEMMLETLFEAVPEPDIILKDGDFLPDSKLQVIHNPGHSEGCISLYNAETNILISGDCLFSNTYGRTDLPEGSTKVIRKSIEKLFQLPDNTIIYPGHGPHSTIGQAKHSILF
jgi:glyoxylase-like metal-dependent hydrolase (beta-lactamase superfamily II)